MRKHIINNHPVAEFVAKGILFGTGAYVMLIAIIVIGAVLHLI